MRVLLSICVALVAVCVVPSRADDDAKKAELKWARGVAGDFLSAMKKGDSKSAAALLTAEYSKSLAGNREKPSVAESLERVFGVSGIYFQSAAVSEEFIAPDKDEVQFKGSLVWASGTDSDTVTALTLRVVKETGRWRVGFVLVGDRTERPKAKK
ncbi:MAG TPA: hypothetical protein VKE40_24000 [Gemmataceae bacterium]|nr:hypothetical protein [Gemmataceae bacterium]